MKLGTRNTTFTRMMLTFIGLGLLPMLLLSVMFLERYSRYLENTTISNYSQITSYFARNVGDLFDTVDEGMSALYDYETDDGRSLAEVLKDDTLSQSDRAVCVMEVFQDVAARSKYSSSQRLVDYRGNIYSMYSDQSKIMRKDAKSFYTSSNIMGADVRSLKILRTMEESNICVNSDDFIFNMVRNFMDTSSTGRAKNEVLGTLFVDVNVQEIEDQVQNMNLEEGRFYVYNVKEQNYIYSQNPNDYINGADPLDVYAADIQGKRGSFRHQTSWIFFEQIGHTEEYAVLKISDRYITGTFLKNSILFLLILLFSGGVLTVLYMLFSRWMNEPVRQIKAAMEEVENGNLDVQVDIRTKDEMAYVADGFNKMVQELQSYIDEVYVARICQKDAELNALKMQIQPHYLYNTLDVIRMTALEENDGKTAELLEALARHLRYVMGQQADRVPLRKELQFMWDYAAIIKVRYEDRIRIEIAAKKADMDLVIPKLILQPIVENSIKHGLREKEGPGNVVIHVERKADVLEIVVMDNGVGMEEEQVRRMQEVLERPEIGYTGEDGIVSVGMKNVYDRIKLNCGREYGFSIQSVKGMGTIVTYCLPIWEE